MTGEARFWDKHAEGYAKRPVSNEAAYQKKLEITRGYFDPEMQVLEFGCGTGSTAIVHAPHVKHIQAIDISGKMLEIARRKADAAGIENVTFERSTIEDFDAPDQSFDAVLGLSILHLLEDKEAAIAKVHRLLKPGGIFVSSTVCLGNGYSFFKFIGPIGRFFGLLPVLNVFKQADLVRSLTQAGFEIDHEWRPEKSMAVFVVAKKAL
ncbi:MAG: class I SAM-dependent methyltransferase [Alphaproteobacteria bacterium]